MAEGKVVLHVFVIVASISPMESSGTGMATQTCPPSGKGLGLPSGQVMDEDGFHSKGFRRDALADNTLGSYKTKLLKPEVVFRWLFSPLTPKQIIKVILIWECIIITLYPSCFLIKQIL